MLFAAEQCCSRGIKHVHCSTIEDYLVFLTICVYVVALHKNSAIDLCRIYDPAWAIGARSSAKIVLEHSPGWQNSAGQLAINVIEKLKLLNSVGQQNG